MRESPHWQEDSTSHREFDVRNRPSEAESHPMHLQPQNGQQQMYDGLNNQTGVISGLTYNSGLLPSYDLPYPGFRGDPQRYNQQQHHVPSGVALTSNEAGMFSNVDLILQAASERLTDPGSGGEQQYSARKCPRWVVDPDILKNHSRSSSRLEPRRRPSISGQFSI